MPGRSSQAAIPLERTEPVVKGVIDLIYERDGLLYLADYKTDRITKDQLTEGAARYSQQAEIYSRAVKQSLGRELAAFKIIFLRLGEAVELGADGGDHDPGVVAEVAARTAVEDDVGERRGHGSAL